MKKVLNNKYLLSLSSVIIFCSVACITALGFEVATLSTLIIYCLLIISALHISKSQNDKPILLVILTAPPVLILFNIHIISFDATLISLPRSLSFLVGILFGIMIFYSTRQIVKITLCVILIGSGLFMYMRGYNLWLNKISYGTYFMSVNEPLSPVLHLTDDNGEVVNLNSQKNKIIVLDFWNTGCGICFRKFPKVQQEKNLYANNPKVQFYTVNVPLKRDTAGQAKAVFGSLKYNINNLNVQYALQALSCGINSFPTILVVYNSRIVYRGDIEDVDKSLHTLLTAN